MFLSTRKYEWVLQVTTIPDVGSGENRSEIPGRILIVCVWRLKTENWKLKTEKIINKK